MTATMTKTSIQNRIRITGTGKLIRRKMGLGHNRSKRNSRQAHRKSKSLQINAVDVKMFKKYI